MDVQQFLAEFKHILVSPEAISQLRSIILSLAFQGSFSKGTDEGVSSLLASLNDQRLNSPDAVYSGSRKLRTSDSPIQPLFPTPSHWGWLTLHEVGHGWGQKTPSTEFTYIDVASIDNHRGLVGEQLSVFSGETAPGRARKIVKLGTVIYSTVRPYLLNIALIDREFEYEPIASTAFAVIHPWEGILPKYIYYYLRCPYFVAYVQSVQIGVAYPAISDEKFFAGKIPIPPIFEQEQIVAKVDELMALCDKLEAQQQEREKLSIFSRKAAMDCLAKAQNSEALVSAWNRVQTHMNLWLDNENAVVDLKSSVAFLGCRGFLTNSVIGVDFQLTNTDDDLPSGWSWVTLRQLSEYITSGSRGWKQYISSQGDIFIRSQDIKNDILDLNNTAFVNLPDKIEGKRTQVCRDDLLITITGANVGKCARVLMLSQKAFVSQHIALVRLKDARNAPFLHWWITNPYGGRKHLSRFIYGDKPGLNLPQVGGIPILIPPQKVQDRIVEALDYYSMLFDRLAAQINDARKLGEAFARATISSITGIRIEDKEKMKAPKTELVSTLRLGNSPTSKEHAPLAAALIKNNGALSAKTLWDISGLEIEDFYRQLKSEMAKGWIVQPEVAYMQEIETR